MKKIVIIMSLFQFIFAQDIIFGIVPQQSPLKLSKKWIPIMKQLSLATGYNIVFKTEQSIPKFEEALYSGKYDIAYMNPYHFVVANKRKGYIANIRASKLIQGVIVSRSKDIKLTKQELLNKTILFPSPKAFAATLLPFYELKKSLNFDIQNSMNVLYVNSHDSVYKGVSRGVGYIGGGIVRTYNNLQNKNLKNDLHIIYKTNKYPSHPIAFLPTMDPKKKDIIKNAILNLDKNLLDQLSIDRFILTKDKEYDVIKQLAIELGIY